MRRILEILIYWRQLVFDGMASRFAGLQSLHPVSPRQEASARNEAGDGRMTLGKRHDGHS